MEQSIFRRPFPHFGTAVRLTVYPADSSGNCIDSKGTTLAVKDGIIWPANNLSLPLTWVENVSPVGPGFSLTWNNEITGKLEIIYYCIPTMFGYNTKIRDQHLEKLRELIRSARSCDPRPELSAASAIPTCDKCGTTDPMQIDSTRIYCLAHIFVRKSDRRLLCEFHARKHAHAVLISNAFLGSWGPQGIISTPLHVWHDGAVLSKKGVISMPLVITLTLIASVPCIGGSALIGWGLLHIFGLA